LFDLNRSVARNERRVVMLEVRSMRLARSPWFTGHNVQRDSGLRHATGACLTRGRSADLPPAAATGEILPY
jgi:hypothetical protein